MNLHDVIVAQSDCVVAEHLAAKLHTYFKSVSIARDLDEMRLIIHRHGADAVVLDLDLADMHHVRQLTHEFHGIGFICTHRVPDEEMWRETLQAGAIDCCANNDVHEIVRATRTTGRRAHAAAALKSCALSCRKRQGGALSFPSAATTRCWLFKQLPNYRVPFPSSFASPARSCNLSDVSLAAIARI